MIKYIPATTKDCSPKKILIRDDFQFFLADIIFRNKNLDEKANVKTKQPSMFAFYHLQWLFIGSVLEKKRPKKFVDKLVLLIENVRKRIKTNEKYYLTRQSNLIANSFKFNTLRDSVLTQKRLPRALTN